MVDIEIRFDVINIFFNIEVWILFWSDRSLSGDFGASKVFELLAMAPRNTGPIGQLVVLYYFLFDHDQTRIYFELRRLAPRTSFQLWKKL